MRVAYEALGETMERLNPGLAILPLHVPPEDEEVDGNGDPVDDWEVDWKMPNGYPDSEDEDEDEA